MEGMKGRKGGTAVPWKGERPAGTRGRSPDGYLEGGVTSGMVLGGASPAGGIWASGCPARPMAWLLLKPCHSSWLMAPSVVVVDGGKAAGSKLGEELIE